MKTKLYTLLLSLALVTGLTGCNDKWSPDLVGTDSGRLSTESLTVDVVNAEQVIESRATIDLSNFIVSVYNNANGELANRWAYSAMPELPTFPVGEYTVKVYSHEQEKAAWEAPYFYGEKTFSIKKDEITNVGTVVCKLSNIKVTIKFTDALKAVAGDNVQVVVRANDAGSLTYGINETRAGYFEAVEGSTTLTATFTGTISGYDEEFTNVFTDLAAGQHRIITFSLKGGETEIPDETGKIDPTDGINVDVSVVDVNLGGNVNTGDEDLIDGEKRPGDNEQLPEDPDKPDNPGPGPDKPQPGEDAVKFSSETFDLDGWNNASEYGSDDPNLKKAIVNIHAEKGLAHLHVKIISPILTKDALEGIGLNDEFDLAYPGQYEEGVAGLEFPYGDQVINQTDLVFDITKFVPLIPALGSGDHIFEIRGVDNDGKESTLSLKIKS